MKKIFIIICISSYSIFPAKTPENNPENPSENSSNKATNNTTEKISKDESEVLLIHKSSIRLQLSPAILMIYATRPQTIIGTVEFDVVYFNYKKIYLSQGIGTGYNYLCPFSWNTPKESDMYRVVTGYSICHEGWYYYTNSRFNVFPFNKELIISIGPSFALYNYKMYTSSSRLESNRLNANGYERGLMTLLGFNTTFIGGIGEFEFAIIGIELFFSPKHKFKYKIEHNEEYNLNPVYNAHLWLLNLVIGIGIYLF
jgi:hypothetical protein